MKQRKVQMTVSEETLDQIVKARVEKHPQVSTTMIANGIAMETTGVNSVEFVYQSMDRLGILHD